MQAAFRFGPDSHVEVENYQGGVIVSYYTGWLDCGCRSSKRDGCKTPEKPCSLTGDLKQRLVFTKGEARAVASAMMGAAAEL